MRDAIIKTCEEEYNSLSNEGLRNVQGLRCMYVRRSCKIDENCTC